MVETIEQKCLVKGVKLTEQRKIIAERESRYRIAADFICDTSQRRPRETAEKITEFLSTKGWV